MATFRVTFTPFKAFTLYTAFLLLPHQTFAAAWTLNKGDIQVINNFLYYKSRYFSDGGGKRHRQGTFTKLEYNPYAEFGLKDTITIGISPRFTYAGQRSKPEEMALSDVEMFLRQHNYTKGNITLSTQQLIKLPGIYSDNAETLLGNKGVDLEFRTLGGYRFKAFDQQHFVNAELAYRYRDRTIADELRFDSTLGINFSERWKWFEQVFCTYALGAIPAANMAMNNTDYRLVKVQSSVLYNMTERSALQIGLTHDVISLNTTKGTGFITAIWLRF